MLALSVAPMMDRTDRPFRALLRRISRRTLLYTEMVTTGALLHGDLAQHLDFSPDEHPLALQLGGDDPAALARCARLAEDWGYDEVNLNCGCPSPRVQKGNFGACLMGTPEVVAEAVAAMRAATRLPVTVKHRIGLDDADRYEDMVRFVEIAASAGCSGFIVHARKAWLDGLSPKENRTVPPLRYADVYRLKAEHPHLHIALNGGVRTLQEAAAHLRAVDSAMIGRAAVDTPMIFATADREIFGEADAPVPDAAGVVEAMIPVVEAWNAAGGRTFAVTRHMLTLFAGQPGARAWRNLLATGASLPGAAVLRAGLAAVSAAREAHARPPRPAPLPCSLSSGFACPARIIARAKPTPEAPAAKSGGEREVITDVGPSDRGSILPQKNK